MKILIIKTSSLGDIIHAFPVLHYLRRYYPQAQIDWVVEHSFLELVQAHPYVNHVHFVQTKKWRKNPFKRETWQEVKLFCYGLRETTYDIVIDLQGNIKSGLMTAVAKSPIKVGFGYTSVPEWPNLLFTNRKYNPPIDKNIRESYLFLVQSLFGNFCPETSGIELKISAEGRANIQQILAHPVLQNRSLIMVCPGSNWTNKQISIESLKRFLSLIYDQFQASFVFVWGSEEEKRMGEELMPLFGQHSLIIDKLSLPTLQNLMAKMQLVIAMDSLPLHLAGTTPTPTYSVFGASSAHKYKPNGKKHEAFQGQCPFGKTFEKRCPILRTCKTGACIKNIEGHALFDHFLSWWKSTSA